MITHPLPGETYFQSRPDRETASRIAHDHYDVQELSPCQDERTGQFWSVRTLSGWSACIGFLDNDHGGHLAILHKNPDGTRTLETLES